MTPALTREPNSETLSMTTPHRHPLGRLLWLLLPVLGLTGCGSPPKVAMDRASAAPGHGAAIATKADLSGVWVLDPKLSDEVPSALEAIRHRRSALFSGPERTEGGDGLSIGGAGSGPDRAVRYHLSARRLEIVHREPSLMITPDNGRPRRLYTDNRGASVSARGGVGQQVAIAGWEGDVLVVETALGNDRILDRYRLLQSPRRLEIVTELPEWGRPDEPAQIRRVYRPAGAAPGL